MTGSAIPRTETETASPVQTITRADIDRSGLTTTSDVVRAVSADNSGSIPTAFGIGFAAGSSGVALRGLTVNSTLVLIDGRRAANYALADDGERGFVDLNTIPLAAVDRIEVLKDGASALYGADAIAGVVNIILRKNYHGVSVEGEAGTSQHGGGTMERVSALIGSGKMPSDRFNSYVSLEYENDQAIHTSQRKFPYNTNNLSSIGGLNNIGGQPGLAEFFGGSWYGAVAPATATAGVPNASTTAYSQTGGFNGDNILTGTATGTAPFTPLNPCGPGTTFASEPSGVGPAGSNDTYCAQNNVAFNDDQPAQKRFGVNGRFSAKINDNMEAYMNASFFENRVYVDTTPATAGIQASVPLNTGSIVLPAYIPNSTGTGPGVLNPNDPFASAGQDALITYDFPEVKTGASYNNQNFRMVWGITGTFWNWNYDSAIVANHTSLYSQNLGFLNGPQLMSDIINGTYNFVHSLGPNSSATIAALAPTLSKTSTTDLDMIDLRVNRDLMDLPGGVMGLALGTEYRYEATRDPDLNPNLAAQGLGLAHTIGSHDVTAVYSEVDAPVIKMLDIDAAVRYDHYTDVTDHGITPKVGVKFTPIEQIAARATYSEGFRAPSFSENGSSESEGFISESVSSIPAGSFCTAHGGHDNGSGACTGGDAYIQSWTVGAFSTANPHVAPEKSRSFTAGMVFQPWKPISVSADYYHIVKSHFIVQPNTGLALSDYFAGTPLPGGYAVTGDRPDPAFPGAPARPVVVTAQYSNANAVVTQGFDIDLQANFKLPAGIKFTSELTTTEISSFKIINPDGSSLQYAGTQAPYILSSGAGTPRWRATWANTFIYGPATLTATTYFVSGFQESGVDAFGSYACIYPLPASCRVNSFMDMDITGEFRLTKLVTIFGDIQNVADAHAPLDPGDYAGTNYNPTWHQAGIIGRFFKAGVRVRW